MIEGAAPEVIASTSTTNPAVLLHRTSTRSRPSAHVTDETEEVDGGVLGESPTLAELVDGDLDATGHGTAIVVRAVALMPRRRWVSHSLSTQTDDTS